MIYKIEKTVVPLTVEDSDILFSVGLRLYRRSTDYLRLCNRQDSIDAMDMLMRTDLLPPTEIWKPLL